MLEVDFSFSMNLTKHHTDGVLDSTLTSNLRVGILCETGVQHRVGNIIAQLVRMAAGYVLGGEEEVTWLYLMIHV